MVEICSNCNNKTPANRDKCLWCDKLLRQADINSEIRRMEMRRNVNIRLNQERLRTIEVIYKSKQRRQKPETEKLEDNLKDLFSRDAYQEADEVYARNKSLISKTEYEELKAIYLKETVSKSIQQKTGEQFKLRYEQGAAIAMTDVNLLLVSRAGTGKTTTIACKTIFLIEQEDVKAQQIVILAFNGKAAEEIKNRIVKDYRIDRFTNARTFHSLAYRIVEAVEGIKITDIIGEDQSKFIQAIVKQLWGNDSDQRLRLYQYFRKEITELKQHYEPLKSSEYKLYRNNLRHITIRGEKVKSNGEKYIADFLFEHGIQYEYERVFYWNGFYRPDFYLSENDIIIEHWGIDEDDPKSKPPTEWKRTREDYLKQMHEKRGFWKEKGSKTLVETSVKETADRAVFERALESKLQKCGVICKEVPFEELLKKIERQQILRLTELCQQLIQKAKKQERSASWLRERINNGDVADRTRVFMNFGLAVYEEYDRQLKQQRKLDFDDLLYRAIRILHQTNGECRIFGKIVDTTARDLKWILIDEYQDFSKPFYGLISAIRKYNPTVRLFCVGDDWQAINGFAGSDLEYFNNFNTHIDNSGKAELLTNLRSKGVIVEHGNKLMVGRGTAARYLETNPGGEIHVHYMDDAHIVARKDSPHEAQKREDRKFLFQFDNGFLKARYLKKCYEIIGENPSKKVMLLSRTNSIYGIELEGFKDRLIKCLKQEGDKSTSALSENLKGVFTTHGAKGLEADIVIILQACEGVFPLIHSDNQLFEIFGQTIDKVAAEERRLFYVAITRAREKLYILTERGQESPFLLELMANSRSNASAITKHE